MGGADLEKGHSQMPSHFELTFPCFIVRRDDASRFAVVQLATGEQAIVILTDPRLVQMFLFERWHERSHDRPLPINTPTGLARILDRHLPTGVTHVIFDPNSASPRKVRIDKLVPLLKRTFVFSDTYDY
jgi:hypothetical protein